MMHAPFHMPSELVLHLPICPSSNNMFFNSPRTGRVKSVVYRTWLKEAGYRLAAQHPPLIAGRVSLLIEVENPNTAIHQDCTNRIKAVEDLLVSHGIIEGDDQRYVRSVTVAWADVEGCKVTVRPCE